ncbi:MAG: hypothetical protein E7324_09780, partial [Clostridiales bacterium]|nr:hypothetical protein [Clostridiales bacterium]
MMNGKRYSFLPFHASEGLRVHFLCRTQGLAFYSPRRKIMSENYEKMTVLELRKVAKEMGVKLGAGISKQGIIEKLTEAAGGTEGASSVAYGDIPAPAESPRPVRSASIITDDESDEDDVPVLTPNVPMPRMTPRPAPASIVPESGVPSSLGSISSKAPAFTMEGSRAWHNPRAYQNPGQPYQPRPQSWNTRPVPANSGDPRSYSRMPQQRMDPRMQGRTPSYPNRFGPDMGQMESGVDYRNSGIYNSGIPQDYQPREYAPRGEYMPRNDYGQPREVINSGVTSYNRPPVSAPYYHKELGVTNPAVPEMLATGECGDGEGVLEVHPDGYGFLRVDHYRPGKNDVYVANAQIRRFNLRSGDYVAGKTRPQREGDRYSALLYITEINGKPPEESPARPNFEDFTAIFPKRKIHLSQRNNDSVLKLIDLMSPIGFGQRALITVGPKMGKNVLMRKLAAAIRGNYSKAHLMVLLVDESPEAVTEIREEIKGEVIDSTFDEPAENHAKVCELALERAQRLVEMKKDVIILTDNLTRMSRAYNAIA